MRVDVSRGDELRLVLAASLLAVVGIAQVTLARQEVLSVTYLLPALVLSGLFLFAYAWLRWRCNDSDQLILPLAGVLSAMGLVLVFRLEPDLSGRQLIWIALGMMVMLVAASLPTTLHWLKRYKYTWVVVGIALVTITLVFGIDPNESGARLWLGYGDNVFQPSEILKIMLVAFLAGYIEDKRELISSGFSRIGPFRLPAIPYLGPMLAMWGFSVLLLVGQKDLGPTFLLFAVFIAMLYVASSHLIYVIGGFGMLLVAGVTGYYLSGHVATRVDIWLNPWVDPDGKGYQIIQSLLAFANGGIAGTGLGRGFPKTIPAVFTDFPLAAIGEEVGLFGSLAVIALYLLFIYRGFKVAIAARDSFSQLLAVGLTATIGIQALIIIAGNLKLIPLTGITLPFVSYGGSSLVANFAIVGLLLRISHESAGGR